MLNHILKGLMEFQKKFEEERALYELVAHHQNPTALMFFCIDSRVLPSHVLSLQVGEALIHRNTGNIVPSYFNSPDSSEATAISMAVTELSIKDIYVFGHSGCGAMRHLLISPDLTGWLKKAQVKPLLRKRYPHLLGKTLDYSSIDDRMASDFATQQNVLIQIENIKTHPAVYGNPDINIYGCVYDIGEGDIRLYDDEKKQFVPHQDFYFKKIVREEAMKYLTTLIQPKTVEELKACISFLYILKYKGARIIWRNIKPDIIQKLCAELRPLYASKTEERFDCFVESGKYVQLNNHSIFQGLVARSRGYQTYCSHQLRVSGIFAAKGRESSLPATHSLQCTIG